MDIEASNSSPIGVQSQLLMVMFLNRKVKPIG